MKQYLLLFSILYVGIVSAQVETRTYEEIRIQRVEKTKRYNDSLNTAKQWKELAGDLYISKDGDIGLIGMRLLNAPDDFITIYEYTFCDGENTPLNSVIDAKTFRMLGGGPFGAYYKDKNHIYHSFATSGGSNFSVFEEADYATFRLLNGCYAIDKNNVYDYRFGKIKGADMKTFVFLEDECYAKDKNGYYRDNSLMSEEEMLTDKEFQKLKKKLDRK